MTLDHEQTRDAAPAVPATMTAWRQTRYGGPEVVAQARIDVPSPGRGEVLLRVRATALNSGDVHLMRGEPRIVRAAFGLRRPKTAVRGMDVAGTVVAVGPECAGFARGDEVVGEIAGGLAEYAVAPASRLVRRPEKLDPVVAAALPIAGGTAWQALERAHVKAGDRVLVIGASGGVGTFTVALTALRGAEATALTGARSRALAERLGAVRSFDYRDVQPGSPELGEGSFDAVIDIAGTAPLRALQRLVRDGGSVVLVGGGVGGWLDPLPRIAAGAILSIGSKRPIRGLVAMTKPEELGELVALATAGALIPHIERTWPLAEAGDALAHIDAGHTLGKIVVTGS